MAIFAGLSGLFSVLVGWSVTLRLFSLARRTRAVPEWLLAIAFGGLFCIGFPLTGASRVPAMVMTIEGALLYAIGTIGIVVGVGALARFPYVVFRAGKSWARFLSVAIGLTGMAGGTGAALVVAFAPNRESMIAGIQPWAIALVTAVCASYCWNGFESMRYYAKMKRRMALGLAHPETTHRFLLWSIASGTSVLMTLAIIAIRAAGLPIMAPLGASVIACSTFVTTFCWWLAFFMPDVYRRRVLGIAPEADAA
ncbi:MAG: hypothetical protein AAGC67_03060 [Myxococcota bacterium]